METNVLTSLGTIITAIMGYVGQVLSEIAGNQLLLIPFAFFLIGGAIGITMRLLGK